MSLGPSLSLTLNPTDSLDLIWGGATRVYNFFSQTGLQPAAAVYIAQCSIVGGDSEGWKASLRTFALTRPKNGFDIASLRIGYPGAHVLSTLLDTPYGSRWLGVLAITSLISNEYEGARCLQEFLERTAPSASQFLLGRGQCEKLWNLGREIFVDSPYFYEFLRISAICLQATKETLIHDIFGSRNDDRVDLSFLYAAYRLWELSRDIAIASRKLFAKGCFGFSQLIFYLTVVCGFHCTVTINDKRLEFGDDDKKIEVEVIVSRGLENSWETGYYMEDMTIEQTVSHMIENIWATEEWQPGRAAYSDCHASKYQINMLADSRGTVSEWLLTRCHQIRLEVSNTRLAPLISQCLVSILNHNLYYWTVVAEESHSEAPMNIQPRLRQARLTSLSERTRRAIEVFAPGLIEESHLKTLLHRLTGDMKPEPYFRLVEMTRHGEGLCDCISAEDYKYRQSCRRLENYQSTLSDIARKVWLCAQVEINSHILRDIGPDYLWKVSRLKFFASTSTHRVLVRDVLMEIGERLAGRSVYASAETSVALTSGGCIVGVRGNEEEQLEEDPGFLFYIFPGAIEHRERRLKEIYEDPTAIDELDWDQDTGPIISHSVDDILEVRNSFGESRLDQFVKLESERARLSSYICTSGSQHLLRTLLAIKETNKTIFLHGCLGKCAANNLSNDERSNIEIIDNSCTGDVLFTAGKLTIIRAFRNSKLQRALLWLADMHQVMLQSGKCVPCAIRAAKAEGVVVLFC